MTKPIQVIERAMAVLESVGDDESERSLHDIIADTGLKAPTAARIAQTLVTCGYLEQKGKKKGYSLGLKAYKLAGSNAAFKPLADIARPALLKFHENRGDYIVLAVLQNRKRVIIDYLLSSNVVQGRSPEFESPFKSLTGRLLLAWLPEEQQRIIYRLSGNVPQQWRLAGSEDDCVAELACLRGDGIHCEKILETNWTVLAAPALFDGKCLAALGTYLPAEKCSVEVKAVIEENLLKAKAFIERKLKELSVEDASKFNLIFNQ